MNKPRYPNITIEIDLTGPSGNCWAIMSATRRALYRVGASSVQVEQYLDEATKKDYQELLAITEQWVGVEYVNRE